MNDTEVTDEVNPFVMDREDYSDLIKMDRERVLEVLRDISELAEHDSPIYQKAQEALAWLRAGEPIEETGSSDRWPEWTASNPKTGSPGATLPRKILVPGRILPPRHLSYGENKLPEDELRRRSGPVLPWDSENPTIEERIEELIAASYGYLYYLSLIRRNVPSAVTTVPLFRWSHAIYACFPIMLPPPKKKPAAKKRAKTKSKARKVKKRTAR